MASTLGRVFSAWFKDLLKISNNNSGLTGTALPVYDALGNQSAISISTDALKIQPVTTNGSSFVVNNLAGGQRFLIVTTNNYAKFNSIQ